MPKFTAEYDELAVKRLICQDLESRFNMRIDPKDLDFEVKTSMNYKAEWEKGKFRVTVSKEV